ncbi:unnamed protein product [Lactuca saligna]|uniref:Ubiquitin-like protease family profile domain-containing protein n=1 Tax=Lactuca saligna TaxID=75948 RepID=A0AA35ZNW3_LACSI|nr:unnamed protein product [Lactuca saligna]
MGRGQRVVELGFQSHAIIHAGAGVQALTKEHFKTVRFWTKTTWVAIVSRKRRGLRLSPRRKTEGRTKGVEVQKQRVIRKRETPIGSTNRINLQVLKMNGCQTHVDDTENLKTHRSILVGNIHVLFNPSRGDIKLGQVRLFLAKAHRLLETWGNIPIILGGDFNSMPQSAMYQFIASSELNIQHHERKKICGQNCPLHYPTFQCHSNYYSSRWNKEEIRLATGTKHSTYLKHKLKLTSAYHGVPATRLTRDEYGEPLATSFHSRFMGTVDYICMSKNAKKKFVNDTIIDFYVKYLKNKIRPEERQRFHFFNINLFEKDFVFIPVIYNYHWSLIVMCHLGEVAKYKDEEDVTELIKVPCVLHMDPIRGSHTGLKGLMQSYLKEEWKGRQQEASKDISSRFDNLRFISLELPQQPNSFDCGLFLLHYVELFLEQAPINFNPFKITKSVHFLNTDWSPPADASLKRVVIQRLVYDLLQQPYDEAEAFYKVFSQL